MSEVGFIGDVHGDVDQLNALLQRVPTSLQKLVFLGDYVNRGPSSRAVIDRLLTLADSRPNVVFLAGNHDTEFATAIQTGNAAVFLRMGGAKTIAEYVEGTVSDVAVQLREAVPDRHLKFLLGLGHEVRGEGYFAQHHPIDEPNIRSNFGIFGHLPQRSRVPRIQAQSALIDTGCGTWPDGRLTCFLWPSKDWIQSGGAKSSAVRAMSS